MVNCDAETPERLCPDAGRAAVQWRVFPGQMPYDETIAAMQQAAEAIRAGKLAEQVWLLEHPPLYTAGTSARVEDLIDAQRFPVFAAGRGGQYTYHGPGQRICYVMLDLGWYGRDVRAFVGLLERWIIATLAQFGVRGEIRDGRVGVWVTRPDRGAGVENKIAAIGIRLRHWVSFHGLALNVAPNLEHYAGIVPCGISDHGVTSFADLGVGATMQEVDAALRANFAITFAVETISAPGGFPAFDVAIS